MDIGLSMSTEFNQDMGTEITLTGNLYYYLVSASFDTSASLYIWYGRLRILFPTIPVNGHQVFEWDHLLSAMTTYMGDSFMIAFRIIFRFLPVLWF